jgi:hypothetical protein
MHDELGDELDLYVDALTIWHLRQRRRQLEAANADPNEVHVYDRPDAVVVKPSDRQQQNQRQPLPPQQDEQNVPPHERKRVGRPSKSQPLPGPDGRNGGYQ